MYKKIHCQKWQLRGFKINISVWLMIIFMKKEALIFSNCKPEFRSFKNNVYAYAVEVAYVVLMYSKIF